MGRVWTDKYEQGCGEAGLHCSPGGAGVEAQGITKGSGARGMSAGGGGECSYLTRFGSCLEAANLANVHVCTVFMHWSCADCDRVTWRLSQCSL